jgi:hypothetical protein
VGSDWLGSKRGMCIERHLPVPRWKLLPQKISGGANDAKCQFVTAANLARRGGASQDKEWWIKPALVRAWVPTRTNGEGQFWWTRTGRNKETKATISMA